MVTGASCSRGFWVCIAVMATREYGCDLFDEDVGYYEYVPDVWLPGTPFDRRSVDAAVAMELRDSDVLMVAYPKTGANPKTSHVPKSRCVPKTPKHSYPKTVSTQQTSPYPTQIWLYPRARGRCVTNARPVGSIQIRCIFWSCCQVTRPRTDPGTGSPSFARGDPGMGSFKLTTHKPECHRLVPLRRSDVADDDGVPDTAGGGAERPARRGRLRPRPGLQPHALLRGRAAR